MTVEQFKESKDLVIGLRTLLENPTMLLAFEVLQGVAPVNFPPSADVTPHFAHIQLGQQTGYARYPKDLHALATHPVPPPETPPQTYEDAEE